MRNSIEYTAGRIAARLTAQSALLGAITKSDGLEVFFRCATRWAHLFGAEWIWLERCKRRPNLAPDTSNNQDVATLAIVGRIRAALLNFVAA